jgi:hypothetical protein
MNRQPEIQLNRFQLALLLDSAKERFYNEVLATMYFVVIAEELPEKALELKKYT